MKYVMFCGVDYSVELDCAELDEAIAAVARDPAARFDTIELRPIVEE